MVGRSERLLMERLPLTVLLALSYIAGIIWASNTTSLLVPILLLFVSLWVSRFLPHPALPVPPAYFVCLASVLGAMRFMSEYHKLVTFATSNIRSFITGKVSSISRATQNGQYVTRLQSPISFTRAIEIMSKDPLPFQLYDSIGFSHYAVSKELHHVQIIHLMASGLLGRVYLRHDASIQYHDIPLRWDETLQRIIQVRINTAAQLLTPQAQALYKALVCGIQDNTSPLFNHTRTMYTTWGISHYLARSGLHLALLAMLLMLLLSFIPIHLHHKQTLLISVIMIYSWITYASTSYLRALLMLLFALALALQRRHYAMLHVLSVITLAMLSYNPALLFRLDFQLSFGLTAALLVRAHAQQVAHAINL